MSNPSEADGLDDFVTIYLLCSCYDYNRVSNHRLTFQKQEAIDWEKQGNDFFYEEYELKMEQFKFLNA